MQHEGIVSYRSVNDDGTATVFVVIDSQERKAPDLSGVTTKPELRIVGFEPHFKNKKLFSLSLRVDPCPPFDLTAGSPITVIF